MLYVPTMPCHKYNYVLATIGLYVATCRIFLQLVPESPRYLIFHGKEEKAKKVLEFIAWVNCQPTFSGRLVTQEKKEQLLQERNRMSPPASEIIETSMLEPEGTTNDIEAEPKDYGTLPNMEENCCQTFDNSDVTNDSDHELLIASDECMYRRTLCQRHIKQRMKEKAITYYHWFLILFKNGYWKTTILLWYLW